MAGACLYARVWYGLDHDATFPFDQFEHCSDQEVRPAFLAFLEEWAENNPDAVAAHAAARQAELDEDDRRSRARELGRPDVPYGPPPPRRGGIKDRVAPSYNLPPAVPWHWDVIHQASRPAFLLRAAGWLAPDMGGHLVEMSGPPLGPSPRYWFGYIEDEEHADAALQILSERFAPTRNFMRLAHAAVDTLGHADRYAVGQAVEFLLDEYSGAADGTYHDTKHDLHRTIARQPKRWVTPPRMPSAGYLCARLVTLARETENIRQQYFGYGQTDPESGEAEQDEDQTSGTAHATQSGGLERPELLEESVLLARRLSPAQIARVTEVHEKLCLCGEWVSSAEMLRIRLPYNSVNTDYQSLPDERRSLVKTGGQGKGPVAFLRSYLLEYVMYRWSPK